MTNWNGINYLSLEAPHHDNLRDQIDRTLRGGLQEAIEFWEDHVMVDPVQLTIASTVDTASIKTFGCALSPD